MKTKKEETIIGFTGRPKFDNIPIESEDAAKINSAMWRPYISDEKTRDVILGSTSLEVAIEAHSRRWPHPMNKKFNMLMMSMVKMYSISPIKDSEILKEGRSYLKQRITRLNNTHDRVLRQIEQWYKLLDIKIRTGFELDGDDIKFKPLEKSLEIIKDSDVMILFGDWRKDEIVLEQYKFATVLNIPKWEMRHENVSVKKLIRYLAPVEPIKDTEWREPEDSILVYESSDGKLELMDGHHRHEFAQRLGTVEFLKSWVIKEV